MAVGFTHVNPPPSIIWLYDLKEHLVAFRNFIAAPQTSSDPLLFPSHTVFKNFSSFQKTISVSEIQTKLFCDSGESVRLFRKFKTMWMGTN